MTINYQTRSDGSSFLIINDDLQFDTRDERIYHESLALPAVAVAAARLSLDSCNPSEICEKLRRHGHHKNTPTDPGEERANSDANKTSSNRALRVLICGGGDGLALREVLKFRSVSSVDVYDYDSRIVALGKGEISTVNERSLFDSRVNVFVDDCRNAVVKAISDGIKYDVIILDLVFPQCLETAKLHSVEWYRQLSSILSDDGILSINAASPGKIPDAYWSIYNSVRTAELHARPFRVCLPSFNAKGYGQDWGFFIAGKKAITVSEIEQVTLPESCLQLRSAEQLRKLFYFPSIVAQRRAYSLPSSGNSDILLHYSRNSHSETHVHETDWDSLSFSIDSAPLPQPDQGDHLLPLELRLALIASENDDESIDEQTIFDRMMSLMPSLHKGQTRAMVDEFVRDPGRFLQTIDFKALVDELLSRASELPEKLVQELILLKETAADFFNDYERLFQLGTRIVTITALVVVIGNLISPDAVYGKGGEEAGSFGSEPGGFSRPLHTSYDSFYAEPSLATGNGFRYRSYGNSYVDETGMLYRRRYYSYCSCRYGRRDPTHRVVQTKAVFKLSPEADVLEDGRVAISLVENAAFMLLYEGFSTVIDVKTSNAVVDLAPDDALRWRVHKEIERQINGLKKSYELKSQWISWFSWLDFMPWYDDDQVELQNLHDMQPVLETALKNLGTVPEYAPGTPPMPAAPPVPQAVEIVSEVYMLPNASTVALRLPTGSAFMTDSNWYKDENLKSPITDPPYPNDFKNVLRAMLKQQVADSTLTETRLQKNLDDANRTMNSLSSDLREYNACKADTAMYESVSYGSEQISLAEALKRTQSDMDRCQQRISLIRKEVFEAPREKELAERLLKTWHFASGLESIGSVGSSRPGGAASNGTGTSEGSTQK
jgi:spermidine synthase